MELVTDRLILRPYIPEDAIRFYGAIKASLEHLRPWMDWAVAEPSLESAKQSMERFKASREANTEVALGLFLKDGTFVGSSGYKVRDADIPHFEIGYWLDVRHTGHGYMREAVVAQAEALFRDKGAQRVDITCHADNRASARVAELAGFPLEARLRKIRLHRGLVADELVFAHTPESWAKR